MHTSTSDTTPLTHPLHTVSSIASAPLTHPLRIPWSTGQKAYLEKHLPWLSLSLKSLPPSLLLSSLILPPTLPPPSFPQGSLFHPLVGTLELFPRHTIILDRTNCSNAPTGLPPTVAPVPNTDVTPTPPTTASQTCRALYEIVRRYTSEPFVCRLRENCDGFLCRLDILDTYYNISIQVYGLEHTV